MSNKYFKKFYFNNEDKTINIFATKENNTSYVKNITIDGITYTRDRNILANTISAVVNGGTINFGELNVSTEVANTPQSIRFNNAVDFSGGFANFALKSSYDNSYTNSVAANTATDVVYSSTSTQPLSNAVLYINESNCMHGDVRLTIPSATNNTSSVGWIKFKVYSVPDETDPINYNPSNINDIEFSVNIPYRMNIYTYIPGPGPEPGPEWPDRDSGLSISASAVFGGSEYVNGDELNSTLASLSSYLSGQFGNGNSYIYLDGYTVTDMINKMIAYLEALENQNQKGILITLLEPPTEGWNEVLTAIENGGLPSYNESVYYLMLWSADKPTTYLENDIISKSVIFWAPIPGSFGGIVGLDYLTSNTDTVIVSEDSYSNDAIGIASLLNNFYGGQNAATYLTYNATAEDFATVLNQANATGKRIILLLTPSLMDVNLELNETLNLFMGNYSQDTPVYLMSLGLFNTEAEDNFHSSVLEPQTMDEPSAVNPDSFKYVAATYFIPEYIGEKYKDMSSSDFEAEAGLKAEECVVSDGTTIIPYNGME